MSAHHLSDDEPFADFEELVAEFGRLLLLRVKVLSRTEEPDGEDRRLWMLERRSDFGFLYEPGGRARRARPDKGEELRNAGLEQWVAEEETRYRLRVSLTRDCGRLANWERFVREHRLSPDEANIVLALLALRDAREQEDPWHEVEIPFLASLLGGKDRSAVKRFRDRLNRVAENEHLSPLVWYHESVPFLPQGGLWLTDEAVEEIMGRRRTKRRQRRGPRSLRNVGNVEQMLRKAGLVLHAETQRQIETALAVLAGAKDYARWLTGTPADVSGVKILFHGGPGTGKTATALALVTALGMKHEVVSYPDLMSPYVSESETRLHKLFERATHEGMALIFDEADTVITRRVEVHRSSDRYANSVTSTMLTELEKFPFLAVLLTNLTSALDPAMERRFLAKVHFPPPDATMRVAIFRSHLGRAPLASDVDLEQLAAKYELTGGMILNVVRRAAAEALCRCRGDVKSALVTQEILDEACAREQAGYDTPRGDKPMGFRAA